jgi:hypothetical protein
MVRFALPTGVVVEHGALAACVELVLNNATIKMLTIKNEEIALILKFKFLACILTLLFISWKSIIIS